MKKSLFVLAAAAAVLAGCQQENFSAFKADKADFTKGIKAVIAADETRTSVVADGDVYHVNWVSGDQIILQSSSSTDFYETKDSNKSIASFYLSSGDSIAFDGTTEVEAFYPASYFIKSSAIVALPATQGYSASGIINNPMYAKAVPGTTDIPTFEFKNLCGVLKINATSTVAGVAVKSIALKADKGMSGSFKIVDGAAVVNGKDGVTLKCDEAVALGSTPTAFYIAVPANNYSNFQITVTNVDGKKQTLKLKTGQTLNIERSKIYEADFAFNKFEGSEVALGGTCTFGPANKVNAMMKNKVDPFGTFQAGNSGPSEYIYGVNKIVFSARDASTDGIDVSDITSHNPIYVSYNAGTRVLTIASPADEFQLNTDGSYLFNGFCEVTEIVGLNKLTTDNCKDMRYMFYRCENIESIDCGNFNTKNVLDMSFMFAFCRKAKSINVKSFDTSSVLTFEELFEHCDELVDLDVSGFDTSNAITLSAVFDECHNLKSLDLSNFKTSNATTLYCMFFACRSLETLKLGTNFDISKAPTMNYMFARCMSLRELWLPDCFLPDKKVKPTCMFAFQGATELWDGVFGRTSSLSGSLTIHCTQETADWLATTVLKWVNSGYNTAVSVAPTPVKFIDTVTNQELSVVWDED